MNNFRDHINSSPNFADNLYRLKQLALQEALLAEAKKKKKKDNSEEKATKDWDKDGKIESKKAEYFGSRDRAIKANMNKESYEATDLEVVEELLEHLFDEGELDLIIEAAEKKKWIQKAIKKEGSLRKTLKVKKGEKIPEKKLEAAAKKGGKTGKRARLAMTLKKLNEESDSVPHISKWIHGRPGSGIMFPSQGLKDLYDALDVEMYDKKGKNPDKIKDLREQINAHPHNDEFLEFSRKTELAMRGGSPKGSLGS